MNYFGTDLSPGPGVDYPADFEKAEDMKVFRTIFPFASVLALNVLERTFDPIRILDNAATLLRPGGTLVVLAPAVWSFLNFPMDAWRILPNFYEEYARRRGIELLSQYFEYVGFGPVAGFRNPDGTYAFHLQARLGSATRSAARSTKRSTRLAGACSSQAISAWRRSSGSADRELEVGSADDAFSAS